MDKRPLLVYLDCKAGMGARYVRRFDTSGAGLGWRLTKLVRCTFDPTKPIDATVLENFRANGVV